MKNFCPKMSGKNIKKRSSPENKHQMTSRLIAEREILKKKKDFATAVKEKNPDAFHFEYYSYDKNMKKKLNLSKEDLKKHLKFVESEIVRCNRKLENIFNNKIIGKKIIFDSSEDAQINDSTHKDKKINDANSEDSQIFNNSECEEKMIYEKYIQELKDKRGEILNKLDNLKRESKVFK